MRLLSLRPLAWCLATLALTSTGSAAISLANFKPSIDKLDPQCQTVYTTQITGCVADDFMPNSICSPACLQGLLKTQDAVKKSCMASDVIETSIIGVFQNGLGLQALCPKATLPASSPAPSASKPIASPTQISTRPATTMVSSRTGLETTSIRPASSSLAPLVSVSSRVTSMVQPTAATSAQESALPTTKSSSRPTATANSQLSNANSGGGSPFDVTATGSSPQLGATGISMAAIIATALLLVVCV